MPCDARFYSHHIQSYIPILLIVKVGKTKVGKLHNFLSNTWKFNLRTTKIECDFHQDTEGQFPLEKSASRFWCVFFP